MANINKLLGIDIELLKAMTDEELLTTYADCFNLERQLIDEGALKVIKDADEPDDDDTEVVDGNMFIEPEALIRVKKKERATLTPQEKKQAALEKVKQQLLELAELQKDLK